MAIQTKVPVAMREVTDDEVAFYQENGWVLLRELISPELAAEALNTVKTTIENAPSVERKRGMTQSELATRIGVDAAALEATLARYNTHAASGADPEFGKGATAYNRFYGDTDIQPNVCVAPIVQPPYYAVRVVIGDLGTYAGIRTNGNAQVLDVNKRPIPGLYAAGNDALSIMGGNSPGPGITLGPAMTFGWIAGRHLAGKAD